MQKKDLKDSGDTSDGVPIEGGQIVLGRVPVSRKGRRNEVNDGNIPNDKRQVIVSNEAENKGWICLKERFKLFGFLRTVFFFVVNVLSC